MFRYDRQRDVEVTVKKLRKPAIVCILHLHAESYRNGHKIGDCFRGDLYSLRVLSI